MKKKDFKNLEAGDIVRNVSSSEAIIIHANYGDYVIGARVFHLSNPKEWKLIFKSKKKRISE